MTTLATDSRTLQAGEETLAYTLRRTDRRRTVAIVVEPDQRVVVLAPTTADAQRVEQFIRRRLPWIRRQRREFESLPPPSAPRQWVAGETHRYLGRQYLLKLLARKERSVRLTGRYFVVTLADPTNRAEVRGLMESWYREHANALLRRRAQLVLSSTTWLEFEMPSITIRTLRQRWGSTTRAGRISFNLDLVKMPLECIDYVVAHELVHVAIPHHKPAYWRMLGRVMPDWRRWRARLEQAEV